MENKEKPWSDSDEQLLRKLASENTPTKEIAKQLGRTIDAIYNKASELDITLLPRDK